MSIFADQMRAAIYHHADDPGAWMAYHDSLLESGDYDGVAASGSETPWRWVDGFLVPGSCPPLPQWTNALGMQFALIPLGKFIRGSPGGEKDRYQDEGPQQEVVISRPFYMSVYPVTQEQYRAVTGDNPSAFKGDNLPVESVSWDDCQDLCAKLSQREGRAYRLPTEAEWEYACRAGTATVYPFGDDPEKLSEYAWFWKNSLRPDGRPGTHPVGLKKPNPWGLHDMLGNVWEWCQDWYAASYAAPEVRGEGEFRGLRPGVPGR